MSTFINTRALRLAAAGLATIALALATVAAVAPSADAATTTKIVGTATNGSSRVVGGSVWIEHWTGSAWTKLAAAGTTNSSGNYAITVPSGPAYAVWIQKAYGSCTQIGYEVIYGGYSVSFWANTATVNATVPLSYIETVYC